jgi:hypothetical protein
MLSSALNSFAVTEPADVREIRGNRIEPIEPLRRSRHPGLIYPSQRVVISFVATHPYFSGEQFTKEIVFGSYRTTLDCVK